MSKPDKIIIFTGIIFLSALLVLSAPLMAEEKAKNIAAKALKLLYYPGKDGTARVHMELVNKSGHKRIREFTIIRKNYPQGEQRYFIYFKKPADVASMTYLVHKYPLKDDERWLYIPSIHLTRRISANDKQSSFVGSDFNYEDVSGRALEDDTQSLIRDEVYNGRACYVIKSVPKEKGSVFSYKLSWIDKETYVIWKEEYYDRRGELHRIYTADKVENIQGYLTPVERTMKNVKTAHYTKVYFRSIRYNIGVPDAIFTKSSLSKPPRKWIK